MPRLSLEYYLVGDDEILRNSVCHVTSRDTLTSAGLPIPHGICDPRMGTPSNNLICDTCGNNGRSCIGHFGHITLNTPIPNPLFIKDIIRFLKAICWHCSRSFVEKTFDTTGISPSKRLDAVLAEIAAKTGTEANTILCTSCEHKSPRMKKHDKTNTVVFKCDGAENEIVSYAKIKSIFDKVSSSTSEYLGIPAKSPIKNYMLTVWPIAPNVVRPENTSQQNGQKIPHAHTSYYKKMMEQNEKIIKGSSTTESRAAAELVAYFAYECVVGCGQIQSAHLNYTNTQQKQSAAKSLSGKHGLIRGNILGRRVEMAGRSVITGSQDVKIDEVGISKYFAHHMQIMEKVLPSNYDKMLAIYLNKRDNYPGCTLVQNGETGATYDVMRQPPGSYQLKIGDSLFRDLMDGDPIGFSRQPSLLPSNISCMKTKVMQNGLTFRMHASACCLFNADFDGDTMHIWISNTTESAIEFRQLASVKNFVRNFKNGTPAIGAFQDGLIGIFLFSKSGVTIDKFLLMQCFTNIAEIPDFSGFGDSVEARDFCQTLIPSEVNVDMSTNYYNPDYAAALNYNPDDRRLVVVNGKIKSGVLDKKSIGQNASGSINQQIIAFRGPEYFLKFVYNIQQMSINYMKDVRGFTIGLNDYYLNDVANLRIQTSINNVFAQAVELENQLNRGTLIPPTGLTTMEFFDQQLKGVLMITGIDEFVQPLMQGISLENNLIQMVLCGSKGKVDNILHAMVCIGQQLINGNFVSRNLGYERTSLYSTRYSYAPADIGFIPSSYIRGLSPRDVLWAAQETRLSLIRRSLTTAVTGEANRKCVLSLQNSIVTNLFETGFGEKIIQPLTCETGINPICMENGSFPTVMCANLDAWRVTKKQVTDAGYLLSDEKILNQEFEMLMADRERYRSIFLRYESINKTDFIGDSHQVPIDPKRIMLSLLKMCETTKTKKHDLVQIWNECRSIEDAIPWWFFSDSYRKSGREIPQQYRNFVFLQIMCFRICFSISNILKYKITIDHVKAFRVNFESTFKSILMTPGYTIGILAAECICETLTQFMLDSHHRSVGGGTKTDELQKYIEILSVKPAEKMKNPFMVAHVDRRFEDDKVKVQEIANHIQMLQFKLFVKNFAILIEKFGVIKYQEFAEDKYLFEYNKYLPQNAPPTNLLNWCVRFELDKSKLIEKTISLKTIEKRMRQDFPELYFLFGSENLDTIIVRAYLTNTVVKSRTIDVNFIKGYINKNVMDHTIRGVMGVKNAEVNTMLKHYVAPTGELLQHNVYFVYCDGINLRGIIETPGVDPNRVYSDSIVDMYKFYGIAAARNSIISELRGVVADVNYGYFTIFADVMTCTGVLTGADKTGTFKREPNNVELNAGFSMPVQRYTAAAIRNVKSTVVGPISNLMAGCAPNIGTFYNQMCLNFNMLNKAQPIIDTSVI